MTYIRIVRAIWLTAVMLADGLLTYIFLLLLGTVVEFGSALWYLGLLAEQIIVMAAILGSAFGIFFNEGTGWMP